MVTKADNSGFILRENPEKLSTANAAVISLALSARKLKNITESLSLIAAIGLSFSLTITVGSTNSSVTPLS